MVEPLKTCLAVGMVRGGRKGTRACVRVKCVVGLWDVGVLKTRWWWWWQRPDGEGNEGGLKRTRLVLLPDLFCSSSTGTLTLPVLFPVSFFVLCSGIEF